MTKAVSFGVTDVGRRREANQDRFVVDDSIGLYAIADGMGGHAAGEVASRIAIEALAESLVGDLPSEDAHQAGRRLVQAVHEGNRRICESVQEREEWRGMGTTLVALLRLREMVLIGHVGDSRAYRLRDDRLDCLTEDHSWVCEQVRLGLMSAEDAARHPMRNIVTRALGNRKQVEVDILEHRVASGDIYLLCSDGLNSMLPDIEIHEILDRHRHEPGAACHALVEQANARGGDDNITVVVLALEASP